MSGTSMATPHAAGVAALWAQKMVSTNGSVNPEGLLAQLIARADTSVLAPDSLVYDVGAGIVQAPLS
jgi:subtilisin family serine protease